MKKLMILGGSILQLPAIQVAKEMGLKVVVVDKDIEAIGGRFADIFLRISTLDIQNVVIAAREQNIDGIITIASDMPMRTVASVVKELNLIGISEETAEVATNKIKMRQRLFHHGVPVPVFFRISSFEELLSKTSFFSNKFIIKPADNSGSRGVILVKNQSDLLDSYKYSLNYSRNGEVIAEEYMEGHEVSVESLTVDGNTFIIQITDKITTGSPYFVEMGHTQPSSLDKSTLKKISDVTIKAINALGIINGPSHTEIIVTKDGPKIVEVGARLGGDFITSHLVPLSTGVNIIEQTIKISLGLKPNTEILYNNCSAIRYINSANGYVKSIEGVNEARELNGVKQIEIFKEIGNNISSIKNSSDRIGYYIVSSNTLNEIEDICNNINAIVKIKISENKEGEIYEDGVVR